MKGLGYNNVICTLTPVGKGACNGDSGGPLVLNKRLIGIVSSSIGCASKYPDIFTHVFDHSDYIRTEMKKMMNGKIFN